MYGQQPSISAIFSIFGKGNEIKAQDKEAYYDAIWI